MSVKVGEGYIEVTPRFNRNTLERDMASAGRGASEAFSRGFVRSFNRDQQILQRFTQTRLKEFESIGRDIERNNKGFFQRLRNSWRDAANGYNPSKVVQREHVKVRKSVDRDGQIFGGIFGQKFSNALGGVLSLLPARLENVFTQTGLVGGTALLGSLTAVLAIGLPALGAMIGGLMFSGLGFGVALASAITFAAQNGKVKDSLHKLKNSIGKEIGEALGPKGKGFINDQMLASIHKVDKAFQHWAPYIAGILKAGAKFFGPITDGMINFLNAFLPTFDKVMNNPAMMVFMNTFAKGLGKLGKTLGDSMLKFLNDKQAVKGATEGLKTFFDLLSWTIREIFDFIEWLSRMYEAMNNPKNGIGGKSPIDNFEQGLHFAKLGIRDFMGYLKFMYDWISTHIITMWHTKGIQAVWGEIKKIAHDGARDVMAIITRVASLWKEFWDRAGKSILANFTLIWRDIVRMLQGFFRVIRGIMELFLGILTLNWKKAWQGIRDIFGGVWMFIVNLLKGVLTLIWTMIRGALGLIQAIWKSIWTHIFKWFKSVWTDTFNWLFGKLQSFAKIWASIWKGIGLIFSGIWGGIVDGLQAGLNGIITLINHGINLINRVLGALHLPWKIPNIPLIGGKASASITNNHSAFQKGRMGGAQKFADGGRLDGPGGEREDKIPIYASKNEYIINARAAKRLGYENLDHMNRTGTIPRRAVGGRVGPENEALLEAHQNHVHVAMQQGIDYIIALANKSGIPHQVTSTFRPGSMVNGHLDYHALGKAVDFGGFNQDAFASYWIGQPGLLELIHRSAMRDYAIFNGQPAKGGGGGPSGIYKFLGRGWNWVLQHMIKPATNAALKLLPGGGNFPGEFGHGVMKNMVDKIIDKAKVSFNQASASVGSGIFNASAGAKQWGPLALQALQMENEPATWLGPLLTLIDRESGGNPRAINLTDINAAHGDPSKGLMQVIGATFARHHYPGHDDIWNPLDNMLAGIAYIKETYGSIFNVQQAVGATPHGYDSGGYLPPGMSTVYNGTGRPEPVLTTAQWRAMAAGAHTVKVYIDGVEVAHKAVVEHNNKELVRALNSN